MVDGRSRFGLLCGRMSEKRWYVLRTNPCQENAAAGDLTRQGFEVFNPRVVERAIIHDRPRTINSALFPSYIFVRVNIDVDPWGRVNKAKGAVHLLPEGAERPCHVPTALVEALQARVAAGEFTLAEATATLLAYVPGDAVPIREGTLQGYTGTFIEQDAKTGAVWLLMKIMGRPQQIELPVEYVAPAN